MIAARGAVMLVAVWLALAALGATAPDVQPSALRVMVTSVVALLAPLFWPGGAATPARSALRVLAWSAAAACLAALALRILGNPVQPWVRIAEACAMLVPILLLTHVAAALLEALLRALSFDAQSAFEAASRTVALALAALGSLALWLGPVAELLSGRRAWAIDAVLSLSPLTHLAVASGNDLLRNQWFYQHSNLAALQFSYPGLAELAWAYALVGLALALLALVFRLSRRQAGDAFRT
ncbi:MAG: hypothetical protein Q8K96_18960 [Rubrivivax sp.]|nr:hypothetical protein [Rubrivivax sp.]